MNKTHQGHIARKRFGQNFLVNKTIINKIIKAIAPTSDNLFVEIGPGLGALTEPVLNQVTNLTVVELDKDLVERLHKHPLIDKLTIYQGDALKFNFSDLYINKKLKIFGNLPYNISTPLMFHLFEFIDIIENMHFMLQKEVALRISASHGSKAYGRLSVMAQYYCKIIPVLEVPPDSFIPAPKVDSAVVRIVPYEVNPHPCIDPKKLFTVCSNAFKMRRKTLRNNFKNILTELDFEILRIDPNLRPEQISVSQYVDIANFLTNKETI